ncbi:MAG: TlpA family protein disulfide reductase [Planctomycetaceae bacterium]|nr:TlpA family protein disulfide reductase [Planctomycetaceae bacterium]
MQNCSLVLIASLLLISGCSSEPTTDSIAQSDKPNSDSPAGREEYADAHKGDEPAGSPSSEGTDAPAKSASQRPVADPLLAGVEFPNVDIHSIFSKYRSAYEASPENPAAVFGYLQLCHQLGVHFGMEGDISRSHLASMRAGEILQKAIDAKIEFPAGVSLAGDILFRYSTALAADGKQDLAMSALRSAIENGFTELSALSTAPELKALRESAEFKESLPQWSTTIKESLKEEVEALLASHEPFPFDFTLKDVSTLKPLALDDFKGKVCIVDIWGTWCGPCRKEIPSFVRLQDKFGEAGFQMIGLNQENSGDEATNMVTVREVISSDGINYPCALIDSKTLKQVPDFQGYPTTLFIDTQGRVRLKLVGLHQFEFLESAVELLLAEGQAKSEPESSATE